MVSEWINDCYGFFLDFCVVELGVFDEEYFDGFYMLMMGSFLEVGSFLVW